MLVKVVMVLVIILAIRHLVTSHVKEWIGEKQRTRRFEKANDGDWHGGEEVEAGPRRLGGGDIDPGKGEGEEVDELERHIHEEKDDTPPQRIDVEKDDNTPLILLWNNYQGDKSGLYNKIFHR